MPGPFPGMDPYLEHPARFGGVHQRFITYAASELNASLPQDYVADIGERTGIEPRSEAREPYVEILTTGELSRVVTVLEVLSPTNKAPGDGRDLYLEKQAEVLGSAAHLIEIDLLREGQHTVAVARESIPQELAWDYLVSLHRAGDGGRFQTWPIDLRRRLPRIEVPLAGDDPDVTLDLQAVFDRCYDEGRYAQRINYAEEPFVPLRFDDAAWADALLKEKGLRST